MELLLFCKSMLLGLAVAAPLGPIGVLCINRTLERGFWAGVAGGMGTALADAIYASLAAIGFSALTATLTTLAPWLKLAGGLFMDEPFENMERFAAIVERNPQMRLCFGHMHRPIVTEWHGRIAMTAPAVSMQIDLDLSPEGGDTFRMETPGYLLHHFDKGVWNSHICQIAVQATFAGPYPFAGSVNPTQ